MTSAACKALRVRYVASGEADVTGTAPASDAVTREEQRKWMVEGEWACEVYDPDTQAVTRYTEAAECSDTTIRPQLNVATSNGDPLPTFDTYTEKGFLAFVNSRGAQCALRLRGDILGKDVTTGQVLKPSKSVANPDAPCAAECDDLTSDECLTCMYAAIDAQPSVCPAIDTEDADWKTDAKKSVECLECIGEQSRSAAEQLKGDSTDDILVFNSVMKCVFDDNYDARAAASEPHRKQLNWAAIIAGSILVLGCIIGLIVSLVQRKQKLTPRQKILRIINKHAPDWVLVTVFVMGALASASLVALGALAVL